MYTVSDFRRDIRIPYAWPGGYARRFIVTSGDVICHKCAGGKCRRDILESLTNRALRWSGFRVVGVDILWEGPVQQCAGCNCDIETEYGDPDADLCEHDSNGEA